ncbi:MAG: hypothetical protein LC122_07405 [Chitinophagales bacterium]|nr:hypothetical protein [Chitinophagales bacterium]
MKNKIAVFQYDWELQVHTLNLVNLLAQNESNQVYLYIFNSKSNIVNLETDLDKKVKLIQPRPIWIIEIAYRILRRLTGKIYQPFQTIIPSIVIGSVFASAFKQFSYLVGVEKRGLLWANLYKRSKKQQLVYYSLELYVEPNHHHCTGYNTYSRKMEINLSEKLDLLLIQSEQRLKVFNEFNNSRVKKVIFLPVSIKDKKPNEQYFLHDLLGIEHPKKIVLYFGLLRDGRFIEEIVDCFNQLSKDYLLVFHGSKQDDYELPIFKDNMIWSDKIVPSSDINKIVNSAHIGLAFYHNNDLNHELTAFSSEKIARYCVCGIPFIAFENDDYISLKSQFDCCVLINKMSELPNAIFAIEENYLYYQQNALAAARIFSFDTYSKEINLFFS